ncbi:wax ester/triacylglycerol synthase family O-acyltransferase [bacterium]|nr:wax ester/triacylglycerol synthase family O-acyltransferase [bacterium]
MAATGSFRYPINLSRRMQPMDALFWYVEEATPELRPLVAGLLMLDRRPDPERLRASVERWVARLPRLRQRVVEAPLRLGLPEWEDDPQFELQYHAREVILPEPATDRHLLDFCGAVFATPLDPMRPLWEAYLIEGLAGGRAACFFKTHHAVMDGVGSLAVFDAFTQGHRNEPVRVPRHHPPAPFSQPTGARAARLLGDAVGTVASGLLAAGVVSTQALLRPGEALAQVWRTGRGLRGLLADLTAPPAVDPLGLASTGVGRRLDALALSLPRLQRIKERLGVSLNDVVLTALSGAVGRYHQRRGMRVERLHCMVPMNLRPDRERDALGNRVGAFTAILPVGESDPLRRLARIRQQTATAKGDRRGATYPLVASVLAFMPSAGYRLLSKTVTGRINLICTNMPGPSEPRYLAGARVEAIFPFAPVALGTPLSVALLSYGDTYGVGIDTDPAAIPDPEVLHRYLETAIDELEQRAVPHAGGRARSIVRRPTRPVGARSRRETRRAG